MTLPEISDMMSLVCLLICILPIHNGQQLLRLNTQSKSTKFKIAVILDHAHCLPTSGLIEQPFWYVLAIEFGQLTESVCVYRPRITELLVEEIDFLKEIDVTIMALQKILYDDYER